MRLGALSNEMVTHVLSTEELFGSVALEHCQCRKKSRFEAISGEHSHAAWGVCNGPPGAWIENV